MIRTVNLSKTFTNGNGKNKNLDVLEDVSLNIKQGEIFGIVGMSGAGKSTLLRCIGLLEKKTSGEIYINDKNVDTLNNKTTTDFRKEIGIIFQGYHLLNQKNVYKNISFPLEISGWSKKDIDNRVNELLKIVGLENKRDSYPAQLSGGQKQRVAIARAIANNCKILLCDEPTSALDLVTIKSVLDLLKKINKDLGVTIAIITHELPVITAICDRVAVIEEGYIVEQGKVDDVFNHPQNNVTKKLLSLGTEVVRC